MIIDLDTHWELATDDKNLPLAPWREHLPDYGDLLAFAIAGDLLTALPEADRPSERVDWMDRRWATPSRLEQPDREPERGRGSWLARTTAGGIRGETR